MEEVARSRDHLNSLPVDIIQIIFSLLPLKDRLACRNVCRNFFTILVKDSLLNFSSNTSFQCGTCVAPSNTCFMLTTKGSFACTLDPLKNFWQKLRVPFCPGASVLAASHNLVCVGNQVSECRSLIVYNLSCGTWKLLPNMMHVGLLHKVTMAVDPLSDSYVIVVTGEDTSRIRGWRSYWLQTEVYDSISGSWRMAGDALPDAKFGSDPGVWHNGSFYCITEMPYGITAFNLAKGQWAELSVEMPYGISQPALVSLKGKLMMIGIQQYDVGGMAYSKDTNSKPSETEVTENWFKTQLQLSRSWSWSGPWQRKVSLSLRSMFPTWWDTSQRPLSSISKLPFLSFMAMPRSLSTSFLSLASEAPPSSISPPMQSSQKKHIKIWIMSREKYWLPTGEMPEDLCTKFLSNLTSRAPFVCAGVGGEICLTSYQSPNVLMWDMKSIRWRYAERDPLFPKFRDTHLLGFTIHMDSPCNP
ncbi:hypothetical protein KP509_02G008800 [Ceratopteris richardii]|nr:hypothetical protein KP509_02G008800 [Ceratopteris richardii]